MAAPVVAETHRREPIRQRRAWPLLLVGLFAAAVVLCAGLAAALVIHGWPRGPGADEVARPPSAPAPQPPPSSVRWIRTRGAPAVLVMETEATVADFARCVDDGACSWSVVGRNERCPTTTSPGREPIRCIEGPVAQTLCGSIGRHSRGHDARVPTSAEWRQATGWERELPSELQPLARNCEANLRDTTYVDAVRATGVDTRSEDCSDGYPFAAPVGSHPADKTTLGLLDVAGNVAEIALASDGGYAWMGGSYQVRLRQDEDPVLRQSETEGSQGGVRCVADAP